MTPTTLSPGAQAVIDWSQRIHGDGPRHHWALEVAVALDNDTEPPPFPKPHQSGVGKDRLDTAMRIWLNANSPQPAERETYIVVVRSDHPNAETIARQAAEKIACEVDFGNDRSGSVELLRPTDPDALDTSWCDYIASWELEPGE